jgi:phosphoenolpyruvate synthase/pyruvate phosphate dikinase
MAHVVLSKFIPARDGQKMVSEPLLRWVDDVEESQHPLIGAKMARLGTLRRLGLLVPDGFAVPAEVFVRVLHGSGIQEDIDREIAAIADPSDIASMTAASSRIRQLVEAAAMPMDVEAALSDGYEELCFRYSEVDVAVAVRSSAIGEDATAASFAGQYESYLGVCGTQAMLVAVRRAWSSLFVSRALVYRLERRQHFAQTPMGVGVLRLVPARCAGVAFSAHPVTGARDRMVIEGSWGWGEAVVQGRVQPDHIEVDKSDGRILSSTIADKRIISAFDSTVGQIAERPMPARFRTTPCLSEEMVGAIREATCTAERHFCRPIDIEWVVERGWRPNNAVTIVQVRPITALSDSPSEHGVPKWDALNYAKKYGLNVR